MFSEAAGEEATTITIRRDGKSIQPLVINLESSVGNSVQFPSSVVIASGQLSTTFFVTAIDNNFVGNQFVTLTATAGSVITVVNLYISDDDAPGFIIDPISGLETDESGGNASFTVRLAVAPTNSVELNLSSSNISEGTIDKSQLTFSAVNWNVPQVVTIIGQNDNIEDGPVAYHIVTGAVVSSDTRYAHPTGIYVPDVAVLNAPPNSTELVDPLPLTASVLTLEGTPSIGQVDLSWTATSGAFDRYEIHRSIEPSFTPSQSSLLNQFDLQEETSHSDVTAKAGITYFYKLVTFNEEGGSVISNQVEASVPPYDLPIDAPTSVILSLTQCEAVQGQVSLDWTPNTSSKFATYEVHRSTIENFTPSAETLRGEVADENNPHYVDDEINATYFYQVVVVNLAGQRASSNVLRVESIQ